ncbi:hypothetical protein Trydic_g2516 [Trypoxylus dichotomus]
MQGLTLGVLQIVSGTTEALLQPSPLVSLKGSYFTWFSTLVPFRAGPGRGRALTPPDIDSACHFTLMFQISSTYHLRNGSFRNLLFSSSSGGGGTIKLPAELASFLFRIWP